jgi:hypothetical protein
MDQDSFSLFKVDFAHIRESLLIVADSIERITTASDDAITNCDHYEAGKLWETRELAGRHVFRLSKLLNRGSMELADCDDKTINTLRAIWRSIERLRFGDHCEVSENYCGALCLPGEIGPDHRQRLVDEPYATLRITPEDSLGAVNAAKVVRLERGTSARLRRLAIGALSDLKNGPTTTTQKRWGSFPDQLRQYAASLQGDDETPPAIVAVSDHLIEQDGPISDRRWQYGGQVLLGQMEPQVHKLASYLFQFKDLRDVRFSELINKRIVRADDDQTIAKHGRKVTKWFKDRDVPLRVSSTTVEPATMTLSTVSSDGT